MEVIRSAAGRLRHELRRQRPATSSNSSSTVITLFANPVDTGSLSTHSVMNRTNDAGIVDQNAVIYGAQGVGTCYRTPTMGVNNLTITKRPECFD